MYQEIVISPTIARFFENFHQLQFDSPHHDFLRKLYTEVLLVDEQKEWFKKFETYLQQNPNKQILQQILVHLMDNNRIKKVPLKEFIQKNSLSDEEIRYECNLAASGKDKIVVRFEIPELLKKLIRGQYDVEVVDVNEYLHPASDSRVLSDVKIINLKPGEYFDIQNFFKEYCQHTTQLIIQDGYLFNKYGSWRNFREFLKIVPKNVRIKIITLTDEARNRFKDKGDGFVAEQALNDLQNKFKFRHFEFELKDNKRELHARFIETNHFMIHLDRGFDFIRRNKKGEWITTEGLITVVEKKE